MKKIVLIDGHSILNRAFYGVPMLTNTDGQHTNALYGFLNILFKILDEENPDGLAVAMDLKYPTFRHDKFKDYKGTRKPMPDELHEQVAYLKDMLTAMNIPVLTLQGFEADDIIGTIAKKYQDKGYEVTVVSGDRDLLQLADAHIKITLPKTVKGQTTVFNYYPEDVLKEYSVTPHEIIELKALMGDTSDNIPGLPGVGEKTATAIISQYHSIENAHEHASEIKPPRAAKALIDDYDKAVLSKWLATIKLDVPIDIAEDELSPGNIYSEPVRNLFIKYNFRSFLKRFDILSDNSPVVDMDSNICIEDDDAVYVSDLKSLLKEKTVTADKPVYDISIAEYLLNPLSEPQMYFDLTKAKELLSRLKEQGMWKLYTEIELPLVYALADMEKAGIKIDSHKLEEYGKELKKEIDRLEQEIYADANEIFNINSPRQLGIILFEKMQLPFAKKTKTGYSTSADVLEKLAGDHPFVRKILEFRTLSKLYSTYAVGLSAYISDDSRIHGHFNQTVTATGRISSTDPNLQNIPVRTELGSRIRDVFVPENGYVYVDADYSQIELRVLASMSGDEKLIKAYENALDIHTITASNVFHVPLEEVTPLMRRNAKAVNFGVVYGISAFGLSEGLSISRKEAQEYINNYFETYPDVKKYLDSQISFAKEHGYVSTLFGRKRPVPELKSGNFMQRQFGERVAMNSPIQGTAADIMKIAMINVDRAIKEKGYDARIVLQVHDELLIEVKKSQAEEVKNLVYNEMKGAASLKVTLEVDANIGTTWLDAK
ncbi:MAG: DNA polymerase I [Lachnospiraceae bacterium]|nr:DNA polymerase I [Candidatus Darwinimomas equi]